MQRISEFRKEIVMMHLMKFIPNVAVSVFAVIVGIKMLFSTQDSASLLALGIIVIGVSALETNISSILKLKRSDRAS